MAKREKVLIMRLGAIGDVVHSTIIAQALKMANPNTEVHFLTLDFIAPLLENNPNIDKVITMNDKLSKNYLYIVYLGLKLFPERYSRIFMLSHTLRNYLLCFLSGSKFQKRNKNRVHAVDAFFNTVCDAYGELEKPKNLQLAIKPELEQNLRERFKDLPRPLVAFNPGGANDLERQGRIWADEYWIELGNMLQEKYGATVFVCGSKAEQENHQQYKAIKNAQITSGKLSLAESAGLYSICDLFISGDSGPLHIASALDINTIGIMGSTAPKNCGPYGNKGYVVEPNIDCKYCGKKSCKELEEGEKITPCMKSISPNDVIKLIEDKNLL